MKVNGQAASPASNRPDPVVLLVDNKIRDLKMAALIAHQLEEMGVPARLEPLEAFRAAVGAHRPSMIVFNHLNASHLAAWSRHLAEMNILVSVLPNEGFVYDDAWRPFMSGRFHSPKVDHFFCWNAQHRAALVAEGADKTQNVHVVGVPRFDFFFKPWSNTLPPAPPRLSGKPRVLFCTNFVFARLHNNPREQEMLFGGTQQKIKGIEEYPAAVESHWNSRNKITRYLEALLDDGRFEVLLRPHPNEERAFYEAWMSTLSPERKANLVYDPVTTITSLILDCDLEISCESCTTAVESWIAKKPTVELVFDKNPLLYREAHGQLNFECDAPEKLPGMVAQHLAAPEQIEKKELRTKHLEKWCGSPDGLSCHRIATIIAEAVRAKKPADWSKLTSSDNRRALKLRAYNAVGQAYHYDPFLWLKHLLKKERYTPKYKAYRKSILPRDVAAAKAELAASRSKPERGLETSAR
jgi:surface carbohydrate biosynthesis protein